MKQHYGTVNFAGKTYKLTEEASFSNRVFAGWFGDAAEGETYTSEYEARACDYERAAGDPDTQWHVVRWQFDLVKGQEPEDEGDLPFDEDHIVKVFSR